MWYQKQPQTVAQELETDVNKGLSSREAKKRLEVYGENRFEKKRQKSILMLFLEQLNSILIYILIAAALISFAVSEITDAIIILMVIFMNSAIGAAQERKAEKALEELSKMTTPKALVKRDGTVQEIPSENVVPGDIVIIDTGRYIPADLRLVETVNLKIEESSLTGESVPVEKDASWLGTTEVPLGDQKNMAFMSTLSTYGRGIGIAVSTGMNTEIGKIAKMLSEEDKELTPLQKRLDELGKILGFGAVVICTIIFLIGFFQGRPPLDMFLIAVSLAVAAIPEGLPAIVTIVLALGVQKMIKRRAIVRKLPAVETLGSVSVICSDKTGTLTQNKMTVTDVYVNGRSHSLHEFSPQDKFETLFFSAMCLCNDAEIKDGEATGDPTETALVAAAEQAGLKKADLDQQYRRIYEIPFDSERKMMTTVHQKDQKFIAMSKGALESILPKSSSVIVNGERKQMTAAVANDIQKTADAMSDKALRVLAIAYKPLSGADFSKESLENDFIFLGLVGMIDPPREEAKKSISLCKKAGIRTIMITGDHRKTAFAIAKNLGIAKEEDETISGTELDAISNRELSEKVKKITVFARVSPEHKVRIVNALKSNNLIVAMTGDGVNDAPSLQQADVGVAMGQSGTDVAKEAADIILTDDNFKTIVAAVEQGRNIYQNIKKSIMFLLSANLGEIFTLFIAILLGWPTPLTAIHILWVNLITDSLPAISLGVDPDDPDVMKKKPRPANESIFGGGAGSFVVFNGILIGTLTLFAFISGLAVSSGAMSVFSVDFSNVSREALIYAQTLAFMTLAISQLFHSLNLRNTNRSIFKIGIFSNKYLLASIVAGIAIQMAIAHIPVFNHLFGIQALTASDWLFVFSLSVLPVVFNELIKAGKRIFHNQEK